MITSTGGISRWTGVAIFSYTFHRLVEKLDFEKKNVDHKPLFGPFWVHGPIILGLKIGQTGYPSFPL